MFTVTDSNPTPGPQAQSVVYQHTKRAQWGLAALVWERDGKRGYRFEDGSERVFREGFYHLLEPRPAVGETAEKLLAAAHRDANPTRGTEAGAAAPSKPRATLEQLVGVFHELFPGGFTDPQWVLQRRGEGSGRRAKRYRDPALADAAQQLQRAALDQLIEQGQSAEVLARAHAVLAATDLVTPTQLHPLRHATPTATLAEALRDLMHEPDPDGVCFDRAATVLMRASGKPSTWPLLTGLRSLVQPQDEVCIRPSVFFEMVHVVSPVRIRKSNPNGSTLRHLSAVARELRDQLVAAGEQPRDMLDVHDFIWETCRPSAASLLERVRLRPTEAEPSEAADRAQAPATAASAPEAEAESEDGDDEQAEAA